MALKLLYSKDRYHLFGGNVGYNKTTLEQLESDYYELKPYLIAFMAGLCFMFKAESVWLLASGILFSASSASIFYMRYFARHAR